MKGQVMAVSSTRCRSTGYPPGTFRLILSERRPDGPAGRGRRRNRRGARAPRPYVRSTAAERRRDSGDDITADPVVVTNHAITIDAPPESVWPWLVQMGWGGRVGTPPAGSTGCCSRPTPERRQIVPSCKARGRRLDPRRPTGGGRVFVVEGLVPDGAGPALDEPSSRELAGDNRARLNWSWVFHLTRSRRPAHPLPLPLAVDNLAVVADGWRLARHRVG